MSVEVQPTRLLIKGNSITLNAWLGRDGLINISNGIFGLRIAPDDLQEILNLFSPATNNKKT